MTLHGEDVAREWRSADAVLEVRDCRFRLLEALPPRSDDVAVEHEIYILRMLHLAPGGVARLGVVHVASIWGSEIEEYALGKGDALRAGDGCACIVSLDREQKAVAGANVRRSVDEEARVENRPTAHASHPLTLRARVAEGAEGALSSRARGASEDQRWLIGCAEDSRHVTATVGGVRERAAESVACDDRLA